MDSNELERADVHFTSSRDGAEIAGHAAWPRVAGSVPAVVLIPDVRGLYDFYRDVTVRLAGEGFFALSLDLYSREGAPDLPDMPSVFAWIRQLPDARVLGDVAAAVTFAQRHASVAGRAVGITGFCMGGQYALMAACTDARLQACVSWYGMLRHEQLSEIKPVHPIDMAGDLRCPYLGLFGADDALIPAAGVEELRSRLEKARKVFEIRSYPGAGHAFFNQTRPDTYRADAAADAWPRAVAFLRRHLVDTD